MKSKTSLKQSFTGDIKGHFLSQQRQLISWWSLDQSHSVRGFVIYDREYVVCALNDPILPTLFPSGNLSFGLFRQIQMSFNVLKFSVASASPRATCWRLPMGYFVSSSVLTARQWIMTSLFVSKLSIIFFVVIVVLFIFPRLYRFRVSWMLQ